MGRKPKSYSILEVLNWSDISLSFSFYSTKESDFIVENLAKMTSKNIILTNETSYSSSYNNAILLKEYEASRSRYQFSIAPQNYHSILPIIDSVTQWISENCETTYDTQLKVSLSFNHRHLDTLSSISQMNPTRLILKLDENEVYKRFPEQKGSPYALSIKTLAPINAYINESDIKKNIDYILTTPYAKFYGIDFSNYTRGIIDCNYIGGKGYASKSKEIKDILEYLIIKTYQSINEEEYTDFENFEMKRITENFDIIQMAFYDPEIFLREFQDMKVYVNLKTSTQTLKAYWTTIRKPLFEMILNGGLREGQFNYDTDISKFQLRKGQVNGTLIHNMDLVSCDLSGILENCSFISCNISKARVYDSKFIRHNKINESYLYGASVNKENEVNKCYIENNEEVINCPVTESVIKFATCGKNMKIDEQSTIVIKNQPLPKKSEAVSVEEIRDYNFIKKMRKSEDQGFQNKYDKNKYLK